MTAQDRLEIQSIKIELAQLNQTLLQREIDDERQKLLKELSEWVNLDQAAALKGGGSPLTIKAKQWHQPCCGLNYKYVHGRKCWHRDVIIEWLSVTDDSLWEYAKKYQASIPQKYKEIAV